MLPAHYLRLAEVDGDTNENLFPIIILPVWSLYQDQD